MLSIPFFMPGIFLQVRTKSVLLDCTGKQCFMITLISNVNLMLTQGYLIIK